MCRFLLLMLSLFLLSLPSAAGAQSSGVVALSVEAGFAGYFREGEWLPVIVRVRNDGGDLSGRLVVRPETSGEGILNTYSAPVTLPAGARQTVFLYVTARIFASEVRVELIADDGAVVAAERAALRGIQPGDRLGVVISESTVSTIDLTSVRVGGYESVQADWSTADLPDRPAALDAVDLLVVSDVDTSAFTSGQRAALDAWVIGGGHLIVTGGANWRITASGVEALLPFIATGESTLANLDALAGWLRQPDALPGQTVIATGAVGDGARVLVEQGGVPLLVRRDYGGGTVDYLTSDPAAVPLRTWGRLDDLWLHLATSVHPQPGWASGVVDWTQASQAVEILPGFDPLPDILPLCGFLAAYIALIGPLNYLVLNRLNRRELAWVSIPLLIIVFSAAAYVIGGSLRGSEATINRLTLVRAWSDSDTARVDELIGLLSPRRTQYDLGTAAADASATTLRPIPRIAQGGTTLGGSPLVSRDVASSIDIQQTDRFAAVDFTVDASFIAGFHASGTIPAPDISGQATFAFDQASGVAGQQVVRGSVRNDSGFTLLDPVILARGVALRLSEALAPGDVATFDLTLPGESAPSPTLYAPPASRLYLRASPINNKQTVVDLVGIERYNPSSASWSIGLDTADEQALRRKVLFLSSLIDDPYGSSARGDQVYLAGWTDAPPTPEPLTLDGAGFSTQALTLYVLALETTHAPPNGDVLIPQDQFTWIVREQVGFAEVTPVGLIMQPGEQAVFEYTPLPSARLAEVESLRVLIEDVNAGSRLIPIQLWNWGDSEWEPVELVDFSQTIIAPGRFIGPANAVRLRIASDEAGGYLRLGRLAVEQRGTF